MELVAIVNMTLVAYQTVYPTNRTPEADRGAERIQQGYYAPNVDILIPTLNESISILKRTLVGCMTINYPHKQIWVLDDGKRPEVKKLARELRCNYLSREERRHYKAGNLNFGLQATEGEIIVILDADFIPLNHFLERTLGFFEDPEVALVVTPQNFYNPDPPEINLGGRILPHEQAVFYNIIQPGRDRTNSIVCTGTSILMRRSSLEEIGGFPTGTIVEDWIAGMLLQSRGYKTVYLNELLSIGSAPESLSAYLVQRIRWAEGTLKVLFSRYNPLLIPGLNLLQKINHFSGILFWIEQGILSIAYIAPLCFLLFGMRPLDTNIPDIILYWVPNYVFATVGISWVIGARTIFVSFVYNALQTFAVVKVLVQVLFMPKVPIYFDVTPKGVLRRESYIDVNLTKPIIILIILNWMALLFNLFRIEDFSTAYTINLLWTEFNAIILWISLMAAIDGVDERKTPRVSCSPLCKITIPHQDNFQFISRIFDVSESGASFRNNKGIHFQKGDVVKIEFIGDFIEVEAEVKRIGTSIGCQFLPMELQQELQIMEFVYCRREHWPQPKVADEIRSLKALVKSLFIIYPLQRRK
ncbi:glycosyltransferase [Geitlerinema sp. PCC 9228]|uniref:glycosyltransferase n=1 Tax=Geitlerinema sp. PCC 9228 TaxID=111611 RepID=UPI001B8C6359|nr:glycosyltransferase [Geitlerinema sp. PCC 9228]